MTDYVESIVRTNKLWCSDCKCKINKGDVIVFELDEYGKMENVYCIEHSTEYELSVYDDDPHIFSEEAVQG